ncbi:MAG: type II toxin-antitoxin system VapC family toxin [Candidatus Helarchaeota archaeon]
MAVIDTIIIFGAADTKDKYHKLGLQYLQGVNEGEYLIPSLALLEFDIVLKSKGFSFEERMEKHALLLSDFPKIEKHLLKLSPIVLYNLARIEEEYNLDYFDAGICAQALQDDGIVITPDKKISTVKEIKTQWD